MFDLRSPPAGIAAFGGGIALHLLFFRRGEWDLWVTKLAGSFLAMQAGLAVYLRFFLSDDSYTLGLAIKTAVGLGTKLAAGIVLSMLIYRAFFHRLNIFPGSFWARLSNVYPTVLSSKKLHLYEEVEKLHEQYGDFVRLGPQELSVNNPKAVQAIMSAQSTCTKGPWYNMTAPRESLQMVRDKKVHAARRKVWDKGFGSKALRDYEPRVRTHTDQLLAKIQEGVGKPMNMSDWFNFYSFDVMGDLAFGKSFGMLRDGVRTYFMEVVHEDMVALGYVGHLIWLLPFVKMTPGLNAAYLKFWKWLRANLAERIKNPPNSPDVFHWLHEEYEAGPKTFRTRDNLDADAHLIVVAGSDTTAASLTCLFFELAQKPAELGALRKEVDAYYVDNRADAAGLSKLKQLDAVINEALRLHPPVPSGLQRVTPAAGIRVGETFIPGETIVQIPLHTLFRDERNFERANEFLPERWTTRPELVRNQDAFVPFSVGPYGCVGKQLAMMEMRYVVSQIVHRYDVELAQGQSPQAFLDAKRDAFTLALGPLQMVFTERKAG